MKPGQNLLLLQGLINELDFKSQFKIALRRTIADYADFFLTLAILNSAHNMEQQRHAGKNAI
jgi:hypothetical protein